MNDQSKIAASHPSSLWLQAGKDRFGEHRGLGISHIDFKANSSGGQLLVLENVFHGKGGPPRHLHHSQDEWFYALEGKFIIEVGTERFSLSPGDSLLAPREVPHVWAHVGDNLGRILISFTPAGQMEAFFREVTKADAMPPQNAELWRRHGMELLGPPLPL
jgi:mannose-6-phosphate isomerase-like protein (cupin superfamily)